jgi:hypothetical protein
MTKSLNDAKPLFENFNPLTPAKPQAPPPEPMFSQAELDMARQHGWNEGYLAASRAHDSESTSQARRAFAELLARFEDIDRRLDVLAEQHAVILAGWLGRTFIAAFPALADAALEGRIHRVAGLLRPLLRAQAKIELHEPAGHSIGCETMASLWQAIRQRRIEAPDADIIIAWPGGEARISPAGIWDEIQAAILPVTEHSPPAESFQFTIKPLELTGHV